MFRAVLGAIRCLIKGHSFHTKYNLMSRVKRVGCDHCSQEWIVNEEHHVLTKLPRNGHDFFTTCPTLHFPPQKNISDFTSKSTVEGIVQ